MREQSRHVEFEALPSYEILSDPEVRENIRERMGRFLRAVHDRKVDALVFLDRSARPLSWLFRAMWKREYPTEAVPDVKFVNIGTSTETHEGQSGALGSTGLGVPSYEKRHERLWESVHEDRWMGANEIPEGWASDIDAKGEWIRQLQMTFADSFDARRVVIVDEFACSGKTQMLALGLFDRAFPHTRAFEAAAFFQSAGDADRDKDKLPWFRQEGMAGVLEIPNLETLQSASLTAENVQKIRSEVEARIETIEKEGIPTIPACLDSLGRLRAFIREAFSEDRAHCDQLCDIVGRWKEMVERCAEEGAIRSYDIIRASEIQTDLFKAMYADERHRLQRDSNRRIMEIVRDVNDGPSGAAWKMRRLREAIAPHANLSDLIAKSKQLRKEMELLAKEN